MSDPVCDFWAAAFGLLLVARCDSLGSGGKGRVQLVRSSGEISDHHGYCSPSTRRHQIPPSD